MKLRTIVLLLLLAACSILFANVIKGEAEYLEPLNNYDIAYESDDVKIKSLKVNLDYSLGEMVDKSLVANLTAHYRFNKRANIKLAIPLMGSVNTFKPVSSKIDRNLQLYIEDTQVKPKLYYSDDFEKLNNSMTSYSYSDLVKYSLTNINDIKNTYYLYEFEDNELASIEINDENSNIFYNGFYIEKKKHHDNYKSYVLKQTKINQRRQIITKNYNETFKEVKYQMFKLSLEEISSKLAWQLAKSEDNQNDIKLLLSNRIYQHMNSDLSIDEMEFEHILTNSRLLIYLYEFNSDEMTIKYRSRSSFDEGYAPVVYEFRYDYNLENEYITGEYEFSLNYSSNISQIHYSLDTFNKIDEKFVQSSDKLPREMKAFVAEKVANKSFNGVKNILSNFVKMIIAPFLCILSLIIGIILIRKQNNQ